MSSPSPRPTSYLGDIGTQAEYGFAPAWIFQIAGTFSMAASQSVIFTGGGSAKNVFWVVAGAVTIGANTAFQGVILAKTSVTFDTGSSLVGQIYSQTAVALQSTTVVRTGSGSVGGGTTTTTSATFSSSSVSGSSTSWASSTTMTATTSTLVGGTTTTTGTPTTAPSSQTKSASTTCRCGEPGCYLLCVSISISL